MGLSCACGPRWGTNDEETMMNILMVCTGNICRSPMAEGLLRHMLLKRGRGDVRIRSAGTHGLDEEPATPFAAQVVAERGGDISGHRARSLDREMVSAADLILVMEPFQQEIITRALSAEERDKVRLLADFETPRQSNTIDDPYNRPLEVYRACGDRIRHCLKGVVHHLEPDL
jgi:protein-tyrosine phosphatase